MWEPPPGRAHRAPDAVLRPRGAGLAAGGRHVRPSVPAGPLGHLPSRPARGHETFPSALAVTVRYSEAATVRRSLVGAGSGEARPCPLLLPHPQGARRTPAPPSDLAHGAVIVPRRLRSSGTGAVVVTPRAHSAPSLCRPASC